MATLVDVRPTGVKGRKRFLCEIKVENCTHTGWGSSADSTDAEINAVKDFIRYFIRQNLMNPSEIPSSTSLQTGRISEGVPLSNPFGGGITPSEQACKKTDPTVKNCRPHENSRNDDVCTSNDKMTEEKKLNEKASHLNEDARSDGNWTVENAKSKLHQFLQQHNIKGDYQYSFVEREGSKYFVAELSIYVEKVNRTLTGRDSGSSKLIASKNCALALIRQLYQLGVIDAFTGSLKVNKDKGTELAPYQVCISPELEEQILDVLRDLNIKPVTVDPTRESEEPISILNTTVNDDFVSPKPQPPEIIAWTSPTTKWNPWLSCSINEDPWEAMSPEEISRIIEIESRERLEQRDVTQKVVQVREHLPIDTFKNEIMDMINKNSVCIIRGNAGCGKTTQVGQFILNDYIQRGLGAYCNVIVTQPKRISAISIADRVAYERGETLGMSVGYSVRFENVYPRPYGSILFCTVGTLLKKLELGLKGISHVIVDEVHERDINTDFILAILRDMVNTYPDLKLILMSATMDTTLFSNYFSGCPVFEIPGKRFPVQEYFLEDTIELVKFSPSVEPTTRKRKKNSGQSCCDEEDFVAEDGEENLNLKINNNYSSNTKRALSLLSEKEINFDLICDVLRFIRNLKVNGAVLIFLPGWSVIFSLMRHLRLCPDFAGQDYVILPLHSCLTADEQKRVFEEFPPNVTKVILSTNIAESSITISDVVYVIDSCKTKIKTFTPLSNLTQFATVWASRTSLEQRRGRAGRLRPGYCFHLCSKARYEALEEYTTPEMFRSPLYELALSVKMLGLGAIGQFLSKAIEPPPLYAIKEAVAFLREMKYLDHNEELTPLGRIVGRLPVEPRLGKMLILGVLFNCTNALTTVAANSSTISGVFSHRPESRELSVEQKAFSGIRHSDHIATINAFQTWERAKKSGTDVELCRSKMLSESLLNLTAGAKYQLLSLLENCCGFPRETLMDQTFNYHGLDPNLDMITALLSVGLYPNIAYHTAKRRVLTTGNKIALINKRSVNCGNQDQTFPYPFFVYAEKVKTRAIACKQITMVTPLSLLLFGARKVEYVKGLIKLDGWINLKMNPFVASCIVSLRPALENLINRGASEPSRIMSLSYTEEKFLRTIRELCKFNAGRYGTAESPSPTDRQDICQPPERKRVRTQDQGQDDHLSGGTHKTDDFSFEGRSSEPKRENFSSCSPNNHGEHMDCGERRNQADGKDSGDSKEHMDRDVGRCGTTESPSPSDRQDICQPPERKRVRTQDQGQDDHLGGDTHQRDDFSFEGRSSEPKRENFSSCSPNNHGEHMDRRERRNQEDGKDSGDSREPRDVRRLKRPRQIADPRGPRDGREDRGPKKRRNTGFPGCSRTHSRNSVRPRNSGGGLRNFRHTRYPVYDRANLREGRD